jgi:nucleoside-diphosphate-sugar epimerase
MHVLVIGGNRFVGALVAWRLLARGDRVTLLNRGNLPDTLGDRPGVERLRVDRTNAAEFGRVLAGRRFDAVVDLAVYTGDDARGAVFTLGERAGHYVMVSTGGVYLVLEDCRLPAREADYDGPVMPRPSAPHDLAEWEYGVGKRAAENALDGAFRDQGFPATRLRIPMVNGENDYFRRLDGYLWRLFDGGPVLVPDGGRQPCRHVYGDDVARQVVALLGKRETFGQAYNLAADEAPSLRALLEQLREIAGARAPLVDVPAQAIAERGLSPAAISPYSNPWMSNIDAARARHELGFRATPLAEVLARVVATFMNHPYQTPPENYARRAEEVALVS